MLGTKKLLNENSGSIPIFTFVGTPTYDFPNLITAAKYFVMHPHFFRKPRTVITSQYATHLCQSDQSALQQ